MMERLWASARRAISISGPPDPEFARRIKAPWFVKPVVRVTSWATRRQAKQLGVDYSFLFMRADGGQLTEITSLVDAGLVRPVLDRTFSLAATRDALDYVETGRARGNVVVTMR